MMECILTNSTQYALHRKLIHPKGIIIHCSVKPGAYLRKYVQPSKSDPNYKELISWLGSNTHLIDYNHTHRYHNFHFFIGKANNENIEPILTMPLNYKA